MATKLVLTILSGLFVFNLSIDKTEPIQKRSINASYENKGIRLTQKIFDQMVIKDIAIMRQGKHVEIKDLIEMVRIDNTIGMNRLGLNNKQYEEFRMLFINKYSKLFINKLRAKLSRGMSYYSKTYNIYWGGIPHDNSMFRIIKTT